jgi:hypothetical protein
VWCHFEACEANLPMGMRLDITVWGCNKSRPYSLMRFGTCLDKTIYITPSGHKYKQKCTNFNPWIAYIFGQYYNPDTLITLWI